MLPHPLRSTATHRTLAAKRRIESHRSTNWSHTALPSRDVDDPDFVAAVRDWFDESVWDAPCGYADVSGQQIDVAMSSGELWGLRQVFAWARKAGVVRVAHGKVHATKKGVAVAKDPAAFFDRAVDALLAVGPLASQRDPDGWLAWPEITALLDRFTVALLTGPYLAQRPLPIELLCGDATDAVLQTFVFSHTTDDRVARRVAIDVVDRSMRSSWRGWSAARARSKAMTPTWSAGGVSAGRSS